MNQQTFWGGDESPPPPPPPPTPWQSTNDGERRALPPKGQRGLKGLVFPEKRATPQPKKERRDFRLNKTTPRVAEAEAEVVVESVAQEVEMTPERLAAQLVKLHRMGFVKGMDDPDLIFYCKMIVDFGATVVEK